VRLVPALRFFRILLGGGKDEQLERDATAAAGREEQPIIHFFLGIPVITIRNCQAKPVD